MFWALIISYPGNLKSKIAVLIMGTLTLLITNGIRMFILVTGIKFNLDINPIEIHDLFNNVIYIIIFLIWFIWVNYFNKPDKKEELSQ
jgi:exosortase/archaeosortase family protein